MMSQNNFNNQGRNQNQQGNPRVPKDSLTYTNVALEPTAVVYNIDSEDLQNFILELFIQQGFKAQAVRIRPYRQSGQQRVKIFAFFNRNDENFMGGSNNASGIADFVRDRLDTEGYKVSDKLSNFLTAFVYDDEPRINSNKGYMIVELDIFLCVGLLLGANPSIHNVSINDVFQNRRKKTYLTVTKTYSSRNNGNNRNDGQDKFLALL